MDDPGPDITAMLEQVRAGREGAVDRLVEVVYERLTAIASRYVRRGTSIEPEALVNELYLRLSRGGFTARDRSHFYAIAAIAMRQILGDRARRRMAVKRGGELERVTLSGLEDNRLVFDAVAVDEALARLEALNQRHARVVELRCLVGLTEAEVAAALGVSERTVQVDWRMARAWLVRELSGAAR